MDETMADELIYIPNDYIQKYSFCKLQFVVETFGHSTKWPNQAKFNNIPQIW